MSFPDLTLFYMSIYGGFGLDLGGLDGASVGLASGISQAGNPPYTASDFAAMYPKFFGTGINITGTATAGQNQVTGISSDQITGLAIGQLAGGVGIPPGTMVTGVGSTSITLSANATAAGTVVTVFESPLVPLAIVQAYLNLATASLMSSRWREAWMIAMGLYIAHYLTLYLETDSNPSATAAQAVTQGLQRGIAVSKAVGDTSVGLQAVTGLESWGAWTLTQYGLQLITMARVVGSGPIYIRG